MPTSDGRREWREILREAADNQHTAALTWQEAREVLDELDVLASRVRRFAERIAALTTADEQAVLGVARVEALCDEWDALSKGESPTTRAIRAALRQGAHGG